VSATNVHWTLCDRTRIKRICSAHFNGRSDRCPDFTRPALADFLLLGWEHVSIRAEQQSVSETAIRFVPISHGLVAVLAWATLYASFYFGFTRYIAGSVVVWIGVASHWLMDFIVHQPDLPLDARAV